MSSNKDLATLILGNLAQIFTVQAEIRPFVEKLKNELALPADQQQCEEVWKIRHQCKMLTAALGCCDMASGYLVKALDIVIGPRPLYWSESYEEGTG